MSQDVNAAREAIAAFEALRPKRPEPPHDSVPSLPATDGAGQAGRGPALTATIQGFLVRAEPREPGESRYVQVVLDPEKATVRVYDTYVAGTQRMDKACVRHEVAVDWDWVSGVMSEEGVRLDAVVDGEVGRLWLDRGNMVVADGEGRHRARIEFGIAHVRAAVAGVGGRPAIKASPDWDGLADWLAGRGIALRAVALGPDGGTGA